MFKNSKVLVAGGAGFIGVNLIKKLLELGANVTATIYKKEPIIKDKRINYIKADLRKPEDCNKAVDGIDFVFMCAANTSGAGVMDKNPLAHLTPNVLMNINMLESAYMANVKKFLFISSNTVYPLTDFPVKESDVNNIFYEKYFIVAWMKRFTEIVCEMYATKISKPMKICVVRPANIYGEYDDFEWETSHVIPALIRKVVERHNPLEVWGDGKELKEFIYVQDFVEGMILAMEKQENFDPLNIAVGKPYTVSQIISIILKIEKCEEVELKYNIQKPSMIPKRLIDINKATNEIGFKANTEIEIGLKKTIEWYKLNK